MRSILSIAALVASLAFLSAFIVSPAVAFPPGVDPACYLSGTSAAHPGWFRDGGYCVTAPIHGSAGSAAPCNPHKVVDPDGSGRLLVSC